MKKLFWLIVLSSLSAFNLFGSAFPTQDKSVSAKLVAELTAISELLSQQQPCVKYIGGSMQLLAGGLCIFCGLQVMHRMPCCSSPVGDSCHCIGAGCLLCCAGYMTLQEASDLEWRQKKTFLQDGNVWMKRD